MSNFSEAIKSDPPRLVVMFNATNGTEQFKWGVVGSGVPILTLIGYITRVQAELAFRTPNACPDLALVITWDAATRKLDYFVHADIPVDSLVGMLETIKSTLVDSQRANQVGTQTGLVGIDGKPLRRSI